RRNARPELTLFHSTTVFRSEEEAQKFYNEHKSEMEQPEAVHLSEILVAPKIPADATPKTTGTDGSPSDPAVSAEQKAANDAAKQDRKSTRLNSSHGTNSYAS